MGDPAGTEMTDASIVWQRGDDLGHFAWQAGRRAGGQAGWEPGEAASAPDLCPCLRSARGELCQRCLLPLQVRLGLPADRNVLRDLRGPDPMGGKQRPLRAAEGRSETCSR